MPYKLFPPGKRGRYWTIRGTINNERIEKTTGTADRQSADRWAREYVARLDRNPIAGRGKPVKYPQAAEAYRLFKAPGGKEVARHDRLDEYFRSTLVADMRHAHLVEAANALFPKGSAGTKNREVISPAAAVLHYAAKQRWCEYQKFERFQEPRRSNRKPAKDEDVARLIEAAEGHQKLFLALAYETGLRLGNLLSLHKDQLDLTNGLLLVPVHKTDEKVELHLSPTLVATLANTPRCKGGYLLPWRDQKGVYRWLWPLRTKLGVYYTPHMSRHALATALLKAKVPDKVAASAGAWRDVASLHRYQHIETGDLPKRDSGALRGKLKTSG